MRAALALCVPEEARRRLRSLGHGERGQAFVEYVLLLTVVAIAVALIAEWGQFVNAITGALDHIENVIGNPSSGQPAP
jgi:Flp pilus assembly pilin Flp